MKITRIATPDDLQEFKGFHILTVAEAGFSKLNVYGGGLYDLSPRQTKKFADMSNAQDEVVSLHPKASISVMPKRFFRGPSVEADSMPLSDFKRMLTDFLVCNERDIQAKLIVVDWHVSAEPVPQILLHSTEDVFQSHDDSSCIDRVVKLMIVSLRGSYGAED